MPGIIPKSIKRRRRPRRRKEDNAQALQAFLQTKI
jgi:hypothetical protein